MEKQQIGFQTITKKVATNIHEFLYSGVKLADQDKATLIAGILIALENETFRNTYRNMTDSDQFIDSFMSAIKHSILRYKGLQNEKETVISTFDFIGKNPNFKTSVENNGKIYITLQFLAEILEKSIYKIAKLNPSYDILGEFYNEFTKYSGADQQSLGIVLTPKHIAHFMSELLEVNENDVLVDTCIGTGSLVLTADMETTTPNKILGVEFNARMLSLAVANMMIRGIDSHLILGDSYSEKILENLAAQKPTKLIINPPYSQDGYPELGFVKRGLDILQVGGKGIVILPKGVTLTTKQKNIKKEILQKHKLEAVFSMPESLFTESGVEIATVIMLFTAHTNNNEKTILINLKNDGYKMSMREGRVDFENQWLDIKNRTKEIMFNKEEIKNFSILINATEEVEWNIDAYFVSDISTLKQSFFINNLRNYVFYKNNILFDGNTQKFITDVLDFLDKNKEIKEAKETKKIELENMEWNNFLYTDLFITGKGKGPTQKACKEIEGDTLYVSATDNNNGVAFRTGLAAIHTGSSITVSDFGKAFYQEEPFIGSHIVVLSPKEKISKEAMFFILTMIEQDKEKYSFSRSFSLSKIKEEKISLPVDENGNPDWQLMEDYIKSLPYSKYL